MSTKPLNFTFQEFNHGRLGRITSSFGVLETPTFIPCATRASIKSALTIHLQNIPVLLVNAFHLQEFSRHIMSMGGIHKFMNFGGYIICDSGGFQLFSMGHGLVADEIKGTRNAAEERRTLVKVGEDGSYFRSSNGDIKFLSAEKSIETQINLGVNFVVSFDECTASHASYDETKKSMERSMRWEQRSLDYFHKNARDYQGLYSVVQGGVYRDLRDTCINFINSGNFFGTAIGGSLGKSKNEMYEIVKYTSSKLARDRPIHLLGIGRIEDIIELAPYVDTFDCVEPTRIARHGVALRGSKRINLYRAIYANDSGPLDPGCLCDVCTNYMTSYIHYLLRIDEHAAKTAITIHNIAVMQRLMVDIQSAIKSDNYQAVALKWLAS